MKLDDEDKLCELFPNKNNDVRATLGAANGDIYNGGEWIIDYINQGTLPIMHNTCLNLTGFIQPNMVS